MNEQLNEWGNNSSVQWHIGDSLQESLWGFYLETILDSDVDDAVFVQALLDRELIESFDHMGFLDVLIELGVPFTVDGVALGVMNH